MTHSDTAPRFLWLRSGAIKGWKQPARTVAILADLASAWAFGTRLLLELEVARHAEQVAAQCAGLEQLSVSAAPRARGPIAKAFGLAAGAFAVRLALRAPEEIRIALAGEAVWDSDFLLYPEPETPHQQASASDVPKLLDSGVAWVLAQMTGKYDWLLAVRDHERVEAMAATAKDVFVQHGAELKVVEHTGTTQLAIGSRVIDIS